MGKLIVKFHINLSNIVPAKSARPKIHKTGGWNCTTQRCVPRTWGSTSTLKDWKNAVWFTLFPAKSGGYIWRTPKKLGVVPLWIVKISRYSADPLVVIIGWMIANEYLDILNDGVLTSILLPNTAVSQDDEPSIHTAKKIRSWFEKHQNIVKLPDLNIIEVWISRVDTQEQDSEYNIIETIGVCFGTPFLCKLFRQSRNLLCEKLQLFCKQVVV